MTQRPSRPQSGNLHPLRPAGPASVCAAAAAGTLLLAAGCGPAPPPAPPAPPKVVALTVACDDPTLAAAVRGPARAWGAGAGATVDVVVRPPGPADVAVLPAAALGAWADRGDLAPLPPPLRTSPGYQWSGVYPAYRDQITAWGGQVVAVPLTGDAAVLVYRADRLADPAVADAFRKKYGKPPPDPPKTWEDVADLADVLSAGGGPALPALPGSDAGLADLFFRIAACYDRGAKLGGMAKGADGSAAARDALSFQFRVDTGRPRLDAPAFAAAADWLARTRPARAAGGPADPAAALAEGKAAVAVLSLAELARLPKEKGQVAARFGVTACPGARGFFPPGSKTLAPAAADRNYIPYFANVWVAGVGAKCPHPAEAFELLAELGGPARAAGRVGDPALGAGPVRAAHTEEGMWLRYGFDAKRTRDLQAAVRAFLAESVDGATFVMRGPDQADLATALAAELRRVAGGEVPPDQGLRQAAAAWEKSDAGRNPDDVLRWRRRAAGLP